MCTHTTLHIICLKAFYLSKLEGGNYHENKPTEADVQSIAVGQTCVRLSLQELEQGVDDYHGSRLKNIAMNALIRLRRLNALLGVNIRSPYACHLTVRPSVRPVRPMTTHTSPTSMTRCLDTFLAAALSPPRGGEGDCQLTHRGLQNSRYIKGRNLVLKRHLY